ncbi:hypothetical protein [Paraburkholderia sp. LEh10]|jgi:hypothetical protein|nr:hypothetical protein [Paraburkholderia sp. LEh10]
MLRDLRNGAAMGDALDAALARDSDFDFEHNWQAWINHGMVVSG